jgi:Fe-S oxidoreductase
MQAMTNIQTFDEYKIKKIVTTCPHCFNTLKNEYPNLGGHYHVIHHTQFLKDLLNEGRLKVEGGKFKGKRITFHDPCYLGRANNEYEAPRDLLKKLEVELIEMRRCKSNGLCCGAGGAQMFKDAEPGTKEIYVERTEEALEIKPSIIATGCPFCNTMVTDGVKSKEKEGDVKVLDIAEIIVNAEDLI